MEVCGVTVSQGWTATIVVGGSLVLLLLVLWALAEWSTRRYIRDTSYLPQVRRRIMPERDDDEQEVQ